MKSIESPFRLTGRRALVTGGTQGVGAAMAKAIAAAGGDVLILGRDEDAPAKQTLNELRELGVQAELLTADLSLAPHEYLADLMSEIDRTMPGIDLLVNNAGTFIDTSFLEMTYERYRTTIDLNVTAGYFLTQAFARRWIEANVAGRVLFTGSINGMLAEPDHSAYDTSKGAVAAMVRSLCVALAPHRIRVNSVAPGLVRTPLTDIVNQDNRLESWMRLHTPNGQVPEAEACGGAAVFLLSDAAEHVQGQTLLVDGGMSVWQQPDVPKNW
ncbi:Gluconate 5-dehydrogenase [Novipirellula galeiformis]|uniref:Gluconate 5-dehydrogenase n=1 Tax=Novipirellula galeiformis TaxID=2528004 RepID=A0A5C6CPN9_9BACT|nr:SDR family oxidoreductase [Novipirellula galeiformis]TWU26953.1 Gluconate 5-dehydrogenase [Novipirellula galeiformis]